MILGTLLALVCATQSHAQLLHKKKKVDKSTSAENNAQPDKVLYERALNDIKHGRHEVGRLGMQTLINTYPDSEYLAKAKLAIADSFYKENGTANLLQAIQGYKDFIVFFPFLPEAAYAQLQVANAHYQQMAKPDRDRTECKAAEEEYQTFLTKYPNDPLAPKAEQRLRDVQEIIAEGDYRIGYFYYVRGDKRAAAARLIGISRRYPLYSKSDKVLWMLGDIYEKSEHKEIAANYYGQIVKNYPLSKLAPDSKKKLVAFKVPVPQPDPQAVAWMREQQNAPRQHESMIKMPLGLVRSGPHAEILTSAKSGMPNLQPEADDTSATDVLTGGNRSRLGGGAAPGNTAVIETVTPGSPAPAGSTGAENGQPADAGAGTPPAGETSGDTSGTATPTPPAATAPEASESSNGSGTAAPVLEPTKPADANAGNANTAAPSNANANGGASGANGTGAAATSQGSSDSPQSADSSQSSSDSSSQNGDSKDQKESSSKKKKGLKKIIPW